MSKPWRTTLAGAGLAAALTIGLSGGEAAAQQTGVYAYPLAGQTQQQQSRDQYECHQWAVQQTGFDPYASAPPPAAPPPQQQQSSGGTILGLGQGGLFRGSGLLGDVGTGAALGAAGGAIAGNAGKGAAIGALAGGVIGGMERSSRQPQQQQASQYQNQQRQQWYQRRAAYNQAYAACMKGRNYSVQY